MGLKQTQTQIRQKGYFEQQLKNRLSFLSGKGIEAARADKDPVVKKIKADIRAAKNRLRLIAAHDKRTEEMAKIKADRAAAPPKEEEGGKAGKSKKAPEEAKVKKAKPEKKAAPPKEKAGEKVPKPAESLPAEAPKEDKPQ
jgi:hypothetical protein